MTSPREIAREEVLDIVQAHIEKGAYQNRFGPESKEFTEMKRQELRIILYDLEELFGLSLIHI